MADPLVHSLRRLSARAGLDLTERQLSQLVRYLTVLSAWNRKINLTSLDLRGFPEPTLTRLVTEPLMAAEYVPGGSFRWFDLGSGGGSPALPLRVSTHNGVLTMVESRGRKAAFLREAARVCGLEAVDVVTSRIEDLPRDVPPLSVDLFTLRAVRLDQSVVDVISALGSDSVRVILFGPVDWSAFEPEFVPLVTGQEMTVLVRAMFHVEQ